MAEEDFDVDRLAAFLHLLPAQISRLADRGKLPGRRVGGRWRFSAAEIHHWLENRIGLSDEDELVQMEGVLQRAAPPGEEETVSIGRMMPVEAIAVPLEAKTRSSVITEMTELAARTGLLWDPEKMAEGVRAREAMQPTALEIGVALLHPRRPMMGVLAEGLLALGITAKGIPFGGSRGTLTDVFFLICSVDDQSHLRTLARVSRMISDAAVLATIRAAESPEAVHEVIAEWEANLD